MARNEAGWRPQKPRGGGRDLTGGRSGDHPANSTSASPTPPAPPLPSAPFPAAVRRHHSVLPSPPAPFSSLSTPDSKIPCVKLSESGSAFAESKPRAMACSRIRTKFKPRPSSITCKRNSAPCSLNFINTKPCLGLPKACRSSAGSIPCAIALRIK